MRAIAILGPEGTERDVAPFRLSGVDVAIAERVTRADAALVFGGDGSVHRHLAALRETQVPLLVVPSGSGNDFARALGLRTPAQALEAWKAFVAGTLAPRAIDLGVILPISAGELATSAQARSDATAARENAYRTSDPAKSAGEGVAFGLTESRSAGESPAYTRVAQAESTTRGALSSRATSDSVTSHKAEMDARYF